MKKKTKVILGSTMTIAMCASLIAGSTLAMFSSRSNVNVAITSGKVDVVASVDTASLKGYSTQWEESAHSYVQKPTSELTVEGVALPANTFLAGGTFTYDAGELKLDSIAPGDAVEFQLNIENKSTLAIQYRVQLTVPTENQNGDEQGSVVKELQVSFDGGDPVKIGDESTFAQPWSAPVDKGVAISETPTVRVELPHELGNDYQGQSCLLHVGVYAVQLGTHVADADGTYNAYTAADFLAIANLAASRHTFEGETIELGADIDLSTTSDGGASTLSIALADTPATIAETPESQRVWFFGGKDSDRGQSYPFKGTLNGNGFTISGFTTPKGNVYSGNCTNDGDGHGYGLFRYTDGATIENLVIENVTLEVKTDYKGNNDMRESCGYVGIVAGQAKDTTFKNITVRNSSVVSLSDYNEKTCMFGGGGNRQTRTLEEYEQGLYSDKPIVDYDFVGALAGQIMGTTKVESVNINLNEASSALTGMKIFGNTPDFGPDQEKHTKAYNVSFTGTSTVVCTSAEGLVETLTFTNANDGTQETATAAHPTADVGSKDALSALAQSVADGRDYEGVTVTLSDDIDFTGSDLVTGGEFKGTIEGNDKTVSGLDLANAGLLNGASVNNAKLQFTTEATEVTVADPDSELETIAANYKNTTVTVADGDASYTITYGEDGMTAAAFNGNSFEEAQTLAADDIAYSFDGVTFVSLGGTANKALTLANSTFGTAPAGIMLAAEGPAVLNVNLAEGSVLSGNTFNGDVTVNGTATLNGNTMSGTLTLGGSVTLEGNTLASVAMGEGAKVLFAAGNTIDGKTVTYDETWTGYTYVGWDVTLDAEKITKGTFVLGAEFSNEDLRKLATENANIEYYNSEAGLAQNDDGQYLLGSAKDYLALDNYIRNYAGEETLEINAILTDNIDMSEVETVDAWPTGKTATGTIDGQNKVIHHIKSTNLGKTFLFKMDANSIVKNVNILTTGTISIGRNELRGAKFDNVLCTAAGTGTAWPTNSTQVRYAYLDNGVQKIADSLTLAVAALTEHATAGYTGENNIAGMKQYLTLIFYDFIY